MTSLKAPFQNGMELFSSDHLFLHFKKYIKMGRGDKKTAKGKRFAGSFGKSRPAEAGSATAKKKKVAAAKKKA